MLQILKKIVANRYQRSYIFHANTICRKNCTTSSTNNINTTSSHKGCNGRVVCSIVPYYGKMGCIIFRLSHYRFCKRSYYSLLENAL